MTARWRARGIAAALVVLGAVAAPRVGAQPPSAIDRARAAVERRDFDVALPLYEQLVSSRPGDADLLIEAARVSGFADRNAEAAARYRQVLTIAPQRRADVLPSLAWQTLWAGEAREAQLLFEELTRTGADRADAFDGLGQALYLRGEADAAIAAWQASLAERPAQPAVERRLASALMWSDRFAEAEALLAGSLARDPTDRRAAWLRAQGWNLAGRHRAALAEFERLGGPDNDGERVDVARAWAWAGFDERALPLLAATRDADAAWWRDHRVRRETRPYVYGQVDGANDADDLRTTSAFVGFAWRPRAGATADVGARHAAVDDPYGRASGRQLQASWRQRLGEPGDEFGVWWPSLTLRISDWGGWSPWSGQARVAWMPVDGWRLDAEAGRELVETPKAIAERVTVDVVALGAAHRPDPRVALAASAAALRFDDGNFRRRVRARADWRLAASPRWTVGIDVMAFDSSRPTGPGVPDRGYWNPERYREGLLLTAVSVDRRPWTVDARLGVGVSREVDGAGNASSGQPGTLELTVRRDLAPGAQVLLSVGGSGRGAGLVGGGGDYWRRYATLSLLAWF